jgi:hypothetical protein
MILLLLLLFHFRKVFSNPAYFNTKVVVIISIIILSVSFCYRQSFIGQLVTLFQHLPHVIAPLLSFRYIDFLSAMPFCAHTKKSDFPISCTVPTALLSSSGKVTG